MVYISETGFQKQASSTFMHPQISAALFLDKISAPYILLQSSSSHLRPSHGLGRPTSRPTVFSSAPTESTQTQKHCISSLIRWLLRYNSKLHPEHLKFYLLKQKKDGMARWHSSHIDSLFFLL